MHIFECVCLFFGGGDYPLPPVMYIGPSFKNEPDTPCRALEHLVVLSSTSQDKVSLEAGNAGNDTLLPNIW
jgi:hypothetical protein